ASAVLRAGSHGAVLAPSFGDRERRLLERLEEVIGQGSVSIRSFRRVLAGRVYLDVRVRIVGQSRRLGRRGRGGRWRRDIGGRVGRRLAPNQRAELGEPSVQPLGSQ